MGFGVCVALRALRDAAARPFLPGCEQFDLLADGAAVVLDGFGTAKNRGHGQWIEHRQASFRIREKILAEGER
jgi:hypothetical protein